MNGLFIYYKHIDITNTAGIEKKVISQMDVFNEKGLNFSLSTIPYVGGKFSQVLYRLPFTNTYQKWSFKDEYKNIDYLYFRRPTCLNMYILETLREIRKYNPKIKIVMEIPTYPYDKELSNTWKNKPLLIKDRFHRNKLYGIIDYIAILTEDEEIFGIKTLKISNGIDLIKTKKRKGKLKETINLLSVAMYSDWHGYDRIIKGLGEYYLNGGTQKIVFHVVGDGPILAKYKILVDEYNLENNVIFHGKKFGDDLEEIYNNVDIALDVFGMFKKNNQISSSLKSREYLAKGLPIISGCPIDIIMNKKDFKYFLQFPNNNSPINIERVINFYMETYHSDKTYDEVIDNIRSFADEYCGMKNSMREVTEYFSQP